MTAADVPVQVAYGKVTGHFVSFLADSADAGQVPDERPLTGTVTLTPLTTITRWPTTAPPRLAVAQKVVCQVINGDLCPPDSFTPGVTVVATDQPEGQPDTIQWKATFNLTDVSPQPNDVIFNVPAGGTIDLALVYSTPIEPPTIIVVSHEDAIAAGLAADEAAASASEAAASATSADQDAASAAASASAAELASNASTAIALRKDDAISFAVLMGPTGQRTWIESDNAGKPTTRAADLIATATNGPRTRRDDSIAYAVAFSDLRRSWIETGNDGRPTQYSRDLIIDSLNAARPTVLQADPHAPGREYPAVRRTGNLPIFTFGSQPSPTVYWPCIVDRWAGNPTVPAAQRWALYYSTDHSPSHSSSGIYLATASDPLGPYVYQSKVYRDDAGGSQCETPTILWNERESLWFMYYQMEGIGYGQQCTLLATSPDGLAWTRVGIVAQQTPLTPGVGHTGYFKAFRYGEQWQAYSLHGSGQAARWQSDDGRTWRQDPRRMGTWPNLCTQLPGYDQVAHWYIRINSGNVIQWKGRPWFIGLAGPKASGGVIAVSRLIAAPLADDLRGFRARPVDITPSMAWETAGIDNGGNLFRGNQGKIYYVYRANGQSGDFGLLEII